MEHLSKLVSCMSLTMSYVLIMTMQWCVAQVGLYASKQELLKGQEQHLAEEVWRHQVAHTGK